MPQANKKLIYITNVKIPGEDAQSIQIQCMAKAFYKILGKNFILISPKTKLNKNLNTEFLWIKLSVPQFLPRFLRYFFTIIFSFFALIFNSWFEKNNIIYSRDIGIVFFYKIFGFKAGYEIHKPFKTKLGHFLFKILKNKIKIVSISYALKDFVILKYKISPKNILVAHDGVFLEDFLKIKEKKERLKEKYLGLKKDDFVVLYSGSFQKGKGIELILETAKNLKEIHFALLGGKPEEIEKLKKIASENVLFLGKKPHQEIPYYLKGADLLILPNTFQLSYFRYTSPLKLFEYLASDNPILASNIGSVKEILNENNAFLFDPENKEEPIKKIKFIKKNYHLAQEKSFFALKMAYKFDWLERAQRILSFLVL